MFLRFIGKDGSMGLKHGHIYECRIETYDGYVWVYWLNGRLSCPYRSLKSLAENWETV